MSASDDRLYFLLQRTAHRLQKVADRRLIAAAGVTTAQAAVLAIVASDSDVTQRQVARRLGVNESAMTALTGRLTTMGLITRSRSPSDVRAWRLELTPSGATAARQAASAFETINGLLEEALDPEGQAWLKRSLNAVWQVAGGERAS